jgi:hypothetical protein
VIQIAPQALPKLSKIMAKWYPQIVHRGCMMMQPSMVRFGVSPWITFESPRYLSGRLCGPVVEPLALHKNTGDLQMLTNECQGAHLSRKRENAHVLLYAHKPSTHIKNGYKTQMTSTSTATVCRHTLHSPRSQKESKFIEGAQSRKIMQLARYINNVYGH